MKQLFVFFLIIVSTLSYGQEFKYKAKLKKHVFKNKKKTQLVVDDYVELINGNYKIKIDEKWGMIDKNGEVLIEPKYDKVLRFNFDRAIVKLEGKFGVVDKFGKYNLNPIYDRVDYSNEDESLVQKEGIWFLLTSKDTIEIKNPKPFLNPDVLPKLIGCEFEEDECTELLMVKTFFENVRYPIEARTNKIQGTLYAEIVIDESGKVETLSLLNSLGGGLDEEVLKLFETNFIDWVPAKQSDQIVKSRIIFPMSFKVL